MHDQETILTLLENIAKENKDLSWKMKCTYSDGMGTTINEIKFFSIANQQNVGRLTYKVETGNVMFCSLVDFRAASATEVTGVLSEILQQSKLKNAN